MSPRNELRLIEQGGSSGNNFKESITWNKDEKIRDYDEMMEKLQQMMNASYEQGVLDDPQMIVDAIGDQATGKSKKFRTVVGEAGNSLMALRSSMPIEEYLETMAKNF
ncbi:hypothetical protein [Paenibacillus physcomitrellae]|uniref:Uncharacterized protein n=1 Tax=Paenibacillus physcomitrellae TaxID=1619311 RepID=A0ABQ1FZT6_9BACL|nr:hypothetical protein [Paenibacillus physcomitrellae]GGA34138.1 hypothetical protein GCM10010917_19210 [Paenibacillus physcomitrellae]